MEDLLQSWTGGNVGRIKVVLTSVIAALAVYQVVMMAVGYGKLRLPFLQSRAASVAHRSTGDTVVVLALTVAALCIGVYGVAEVLDEGAAVTVHAVAGGAAIGLLGFKIAVLRRWQQLSRWLPALGLSVFGLFVLTWVTSSADRLGG